MAGGVVPFARSSESIMVDGQEQAQAFAQSSAAVAEQANQGRVGEAQPTTAQDAPPRDEPRVPRREPPAAA